MSLSPANQIKDEYYTWSAFISPGANAKQGVNIDCPFVPDHVEFQCIFIGKRGADDTKLLVDPEVVQINGVADVNAPFIAAALIRCDELTAFNNGELCIANMNNTVNPIFRYSNQSRVTFKSRFNFSLWALPAAGENNANRMASGAVYLIINFSSYSPFHVK